MRRSATLLRNEGTVTCVGEAARKTRSNQCGTVDALQPSPRRAQKLEAMPHAPESAHAMCCRRRRRRQRLPPSAACCRHSRRTRALLALALCFAGAPTRSACAPTYRRSRYGRQGACLCCSTRTSTGAACPCLAPTASQATPPPSQPAPPPAPSPVLSPHLPTDAGRCRKRLATVPLLSACLADVTVYPSRQYRPGLPEHAALLAAVQGAEQGRYPLLVLFPGGGARCCCCCCACAIIHCRRCCHSKPTQFPLPHLPAWQAAKLHQKPTAPPPVCFPRRRPQRGGCGGRAAPQQRAARGSGAGAAAGGAAGAAAAAVGWRWRRPRGPLCCQR